MTMTELDKAIVAIRENATIKATAEHFRVSA